MKMKKEQSGRGKMLAKIIDDDLGKMGYPLTLRVNLLFAMQHIRGRLANLRLLKKKFFPLS